MYTDSNFKYSAKKKEIMKELKEQWHILNHNWAAILHVFSYKIFALFLKFQ